jgi:FtsP/CotA-like multicopper oxidase with cupredoxin domain
MEQREGIPDDDVAVVREFIFERGKHAWQVNGRFYDPTIANSAPQIATEGEPQQRDLAEEWILRTGGGGWWHPIHIHLESHQLVSYEKDFTADDVIGPIDAVPVRPPIAPVDVTAQIPTTEVIANHDTTILGPNTVARIRMRFRTWPGPFVFHCHHLEHEDMRMMFNFEVVPGPAHDPDVAPAARSHGNAVTLDGRDAANPAGRVGELAWEHPPVPPTPVHEAGEFLIDPRTPPQRS